MTPAPADRPVGSPPVTSSMRRRWIDRGAGALCGVGLFAAGLASADLLGPGSNRVTPAARADAYGIQAANLVRAELDAAEDRPLLAGGEALARVSRLASPSVVHIESRYRDEDGAGVEETGSGVLARHPNWSGTGDAGRLFVLTNRHVVQGGGTGGVDLSLANGRHVRPVRVWTDKATDIAVLEIDNLDLPAIRFGNSDALEIGHFVLALGSPFGLDRSVTLGIVSAQGPPAAGTGRGRPDESGLPPDRRRHQSREQRRPAAGPARPAGRAEHRDRFGRRRARGGRVLDPREPGAAGVRRARHAQPGPPGVPRRAAGQPVRHRRRGPGRAGTGCTGPGCGS